MQSDIAARRAPRGLRTAGVIAGVAAAGIITGGLLLRGADANEAENWSSGRSIPTVHLIAVGGANGSGALSLPGTMQAWNSAKIYARVGGYIKAWYKDIGADVPAGGALSVIDTPELDQQIVQARAAFARAKADASLAKSTAARWNDLLSTNSVSHQEADEKNGALAASTAAKQATEADLGRLLAMKSFATLRAPFAGVVTTRSADIGDLVGPGSLSQQPLFSVADLRRVRIYVSVPQAYSAVVKNGLKGIITVPDYPGRQWHAEVVGSSGAINGQTGAFNVQLVTDNPGQALKPGGYAQVLFDVPGQSGTVTIPSSALIFRAEGAQVAMVRPDGHAVLKKITIGRDLGGSVEVTHGLTAGTKIVDTPPDSISDGELVRVGA